ncbi:hypothetical protein [Sediminitomix flava]|uniref:Uncharacterized protein n=1 Tax=Sediminitomix flava TaxID=379075 RepID=A0A315YQC6_SEDFL|nr:hypothetical protein [Sediminitomix flava]PWJ29134.1 hypothetical protein BC781_1342 [Sediminitomix flava]
MKFKRVLISIVLILGLISGVWLYPIIDTFFKVDSCLDKGGWWNYEIQECDLSNDLELKSRKGHHGYNQLANEQQKNIFTVSEYNTDLETVNIERPEKTIITNVSLDTTYLFKIWTLDPNGPHADFWIRRDEFYVVDYDGDGAMPYILNSDSLTVFYNDFVQKGRIISVSKDTLSIHWDDSENPTEYVEWKN